MTKGQIAKRFLKTSNLLSWYNRPYVYAWKRGETYLYVGYSRSLYNRILSHDVIGVTEPFLETDVLEIKEFTSLSEAKAHEHFLIDHYVPKHNYKRKYFRGQYRYLTKPPEITSTQEHLIGANIGLSPQPQN